MDDPLTIVCGAIDNHVKMINEYKGVPGVQAGRLQEGYQVLESLLRQTPPPPPPPFITTAAFSPLSAAFMHVATPGVDSVVDLPADSVARHFWASSSLPSGYAFYLTLFI